ncbi:MAG: tRNA (cytidine(34)-2'-O)-methyltransferase, partial [Gemmataceae bacterium]|nr:tRNA (cytidine(34)-2'-O)-methyltransferase [Gemmataceae bacterium]
IPPNTGNIARLCAATGAALHLIGRLGFRLNDRALRRAGLEYWDEIEKHRHDSLTDFEAGWVKSDHDPERIFCYSARATRQYTSVKYRAGDALLFGGETAGLPEEVIARYGDRALLIPMPAGISILAFGKLGTPSAHMREESPCRGNVRSLNLANAVAVVLYEALRQLHDW